MKSPAPLDAKVAAERVLGWQTKLHRWAAQDEQARFGDLFNGAPACSVGGVTGA